jgi:hypothetical protein
MNVVLPCDGAKDSLGRRKAFTTRVVMGAKVFAAVSPIFLGRFPTLLPRVVVHRKNAYMFPIMFEPFLT